jgi:ubiquinone/menaquinone biosynthesis C-methylase UbiE
VKPKQFSSKKWKPEDYTNKNVICDDLYGDPTRYQLRGKTLEKYTRGSPGEILKVGLKLLNLTPTDQCIDVGAGNGYFSGLMEPVLTYPITALDISLGQVIEGKSKYPKFQWCVADVDNLPFMDGYFDVACANFMLYHLDNPQTGLAEIARILKPTGRQLILTKGSNTYHQMDEWYRTALLELGITDQSPRDEARLSELNIDTLCNFAFHITRKVHIESWIDFPNIDTMLDYFNSTPRYHYLVSEEQWLPFLERIGQIGFQNNMQVQKIEWAFLLEKNS